MENLEKIICASNYYNDGIVYTHSPKNIAIGYVICGRRHHNCLQTFAQIYGFPYNEKALAIMQTEVEGFMTSENRFLDRKEAYIVALKSNQVSPKEKEYLYSEDLY